MKQKAENILKIVASAITIWIFIDSASKILFDYSFLDHALKAIGMANGIFDIPLWIRIIIIAALALFLFEYDWFYDHFVRDERDRKYK